VSIVGFCFPSDGALDGAPATGGAGSLEARQQHRTAVAPTPARGRHGKERRGGGTRAGRTRAGAQAFAATALFLHERKAKAPGLVKRERAGIWPSKEIKTKGDLREKERKQEKDRTKER